MPSGWGEHLVAKLTDLTLESNTPSRASVHNPTARLRPITVHVSRWPNMYFDFVFVPFIVVSGMFVV